MNQNLIEKDQPWNPEKQISTRNENNNDHMNIQNENNVTVGQNHHFNPFTNENTKYPNINDPKSSENSFDELENNNNEGHSTFDMKDNLLCNFLYFILFYFIIYLYFRK